MISATQETPVHSPQIISPCDKTHTSSAVSQGLFTLEVKVRSEPHKKSTGQGKILSHNLSSFCLLLCVLSFFPPILFNPQLAFLEASIHHSLYLFLCLFPNCQGPADSFFITSVCRAEVQLQAGLHSEAVKVEVYQSVM